MRSNSHFNLSNVVRVVLAVLCAVFGGNTLRAQQATPTKTVLEFEGNKVFSNEELRQAGNTCLAGFSNSSDQDTPLDYCLHRVTSYMRSKGYLQARLSRARQVPIENGFMTVVSVEEGALFRLGTVQIDGAKVLSPGQIREMLDLKTGDIANAVQSPRFNSLETEAWARTCCYGRCFCGTAKFSVRNCWTRVLSD